MFRRQPSPLPGYGLTIGYTMLSLSLVVLLPLGALLLKTYGVGWSEFWRHVSTPRAAAAYRLTFGAAFVAASLNTLGGLLLAWVLARYSFPGRRILDALIDVPFALPTAVGGLALASVYAPNGWIGREVGPGTALGHWFGAEGLKLAYNRTGVVIALVFVSFPFVVRTVQPVVEMLDQGLEEASATLGAGRLRTFLQVILPTLFPSLLTGFTLSFARGIGEFGSIQYMSSNTPYQTQIAPQLIIQHLDAYEIEAALSIAVFLLAVSFLLLGLINLLESRARRYLGA